MLTIEEKKHKRAMQRKELLRQRAKQKKSYWAKKKKLEVEPPTYIAKKYTPRGLNLTKEEREHLMLWSELGITNPPPAPHI